MDNATSEYAFISSFFSNDIALPQQNSSSPAATGGTGIVSPDGAGSFFGMRSPSGSDFGQQQPLNVQQPLRSAMSSTTPGLGGFVSFVAKSKEEQAVIDTIWKQVIDPVMDYCQVRAYYLTDIGFVFT